MSLILRVRTTIAGFPGGPGLSTCYFRTTAGNEASDATAAVARVRGAFDVLKSIMAPGATFQVQGTCDALDDQDGELFSSVVVAAPAIVTGTGGSDQAPVEVAAGLKIATGQVADGKRVNGRLFLSPLCLAAVTGKVPPAGVVTTVNAFGVALLTVSPPAAVAPLVVWRRPRATPFRAGASYNALGSTVDADKFWVLRSRRD